jgi:hypothetical protein
MTCGAGSVAWDVCGNCRDDAVVAHFVGHCWGGAFCGAGRLDGELIWGGLRGLR